ncbi:hypothetical protein PIIN_11410 [Serendipita indica DSM 11827]|uniref:Uncharacterized protein n=1 Tax=Serendipita indica (strain DSM 11827) TaxID=1109443 RepID=G4U1J0_SERID|nr:hypothetical protein PIIN_11410 [Serendipita indica DSM 11827]
MEHAKHAVYVSNTSYYLWKHGEPWWGVNGGNLGSSYTMNIDQLDAPIIQLIGVNLEATAVERCLDPRGGNIKALSVMFGIDRTTAFSFRALTHPRLQHLVALSFETRYPLKISEPFSLPSVRCLFVKLGRYYGLDREQDTLSKLTFPKLSAFDVEKSLGRLRRYQLYPAPDPPEFPWGPPDFPWEDVHYYFTAEDFARFDVEEDGLLETV